MKRRISIFFLSVLISVLFSTVSYAMSDMGREHDRPSRAAENVNEAEYIWTWLNDEHCVKFRTYDQYNKEILLKYWNTGMIPNWTEKVNGKWEVQKRDTYAGKWTQAENGVWTFKFDDCTIPIGVTNIDNVVYAFNGYGELKEGYNYWGDLKTGADGLVVTDNQEFLIWLSTQYLPACTSHK